MIAIARYPTSRKSNLESRTVPSQKKPALARRNRAALLYRGISDLLIEKSLQLINK